MKLINGFIPDEIFFNEYLPDKSKLLYIYLLSKADDKGVCHGLTTSELSKKFWFKIRNVQMHLKNLLEFNLIDKSLDRYNTTVPRVVLDRDKNPKVPRTLSQGSRLVPSKDFLKLIDVWNELFKTNVVYTSELYKLYLDRSENIKESDILKAIRNRYKGIKDSQEYKDPSKSYFRSSLKHFLRDHESVDVWVNSDGSNEDDLKKFNFY